MKLKITFNISPDRRSFLRDTFKAMREEGDLWLHGVKVWRGTSPPPWAMAVEAYPSGLMDGFFEELWYRSRFGGYELRYPDIPKMGWYGQKGEGEREFEVDLEAGEYDLYMAPMDLNPLYCSISINGTSYIGYNATRDQILHLRIRISAIPLLSGAVGWVMVPIGYYLYDGLMRYDHSIPISGVLRDPSGKILAVESFGRLTYVTEEYVSSLAPEYRTAFEEGYVSPVPLPTEGVTPVPAVSPESEAGEAVEELTEAVTPTSPEEALAEATEEATEINRAVEEELRRREEEIRREEESRRTEETYRTYETKREGFGFDLSSITGFLPIVLIIMVISFLRR